MFEELKGPGFNEFVEATRPGNRPMMREFVQVLKPRSSKEWIALGARVASVYNPVYGVLLASVNTELMAGKELRTARKIHDLLPLLRESGLDMPEAKITEIAKISKFYFLVRYPDINRKFFATPQIAKTTLEKTKEIFLWIEKKLTE